MFGQAIRLEALLDSLLHDIFESGALRSMQAELTTMAVVRVRHRGGTWSLASTLVTYRIRLDRKKICRPEHVAE